MKNLSSKWQKIIVWFTGYLNVIAFFLAGGFTYLKTEDEDVKGSCKTVFVLLIGFTALEILRMIIYNILAVTSVGYDVLNAFNDIALILNVIKAIVFVTFCILDLCGIKIIPVKAPVSKSKDDGTKKSEE